MAHDRFIAWGEKRPYNADEMGNLLRDFFGGVGEIQFTAEGNMRFRWTISLPGKPTHPLQTVSKQNLSAMLNSERWIEVILSPKDLDILTRLQDDFTNSLAEGLAKVVCLWYGVEREPS